MAAMKTFASDVANYIRSLSDDAIITLVNHLPTDVHMRLLAEANPGVFGQADQPGKVGVAFEATNLETGAVREVVIPLVPEQPEGVSAR